MKLYQTTTDAFSWFISLMRTRRFNIFATNHFQTTTKIAILIAVVCFAIGPAGSAKAYPKRKSSDKIFNKLVQVMMSGIYKSEEPDPDPIEWPTPTENVMEYGFEFMVLDETLVTQDTSGDWPVDSIYDFEFSLNLQLGEGLIEEHTGVGTLQVIGSAAGGNEPLVFNMELLEFNLSGTFATSPPTPFLFRESPTEQSTVTTTNTSISADLYESSSIANIYLELSLDGGQTWTAAQAVVPEPSTLLLGALASMGLLMRRRRLS